MGKPSNHDPKKYLDVVADSCIGREAIAQLGYNVAQVRRMPEHMAPAVAKAVQAQLRRNHPSIFG